MSMDPRKISELLTDHGSAQDGDIIPGNRGGVTGRVTHRDRSSLMVLSESTSGLVMVGDAATLQLPDPGAGRFYSHLDVRFLWYYALAGNANNINFAIWQGTSEANYGQTATKRYSFTRSTGGVDETDWVAYGNENTGSTYSVGILFSLNTLTGNAHTIEYDPTTHQLAYLEVSNTTPTYIPKLHTISVFGTIGG